MSKASNKTDDSNSEELHADVWLFGFVVGTRECSGWNERKRNERTREAGFSVVVQKASEEVQSRLSRMVCCESGNCLTEHLPKAWLAADKFVYSSNSTITLV